MAKPPRRLSARTLEVQVLSPITHSNYTAGTQLEFIANGDESGAVCPLTPYETSRAAWRWLRGLGRLARVGSASMRQISSALSS
jgi:hypothetical protein